MREAWASVWRGTNRLSRADRGITTALNYVLVLGIVSILVTTLILGFGGLVENQQERALRSQMEVVGNRVAGDVEQVDTLARHAADGNAVSVRADLPSDVVGARYRLTVTDEGDDRYLLTVESTDPDVVVRVPFRSSTDVAEGTVYGGPLEIAYDPDADQVVIGRA